MFRVNTTRRNNTKRAPSPFRPLTDLSGALAAASVAAAAAATATAAAAAAPTSLEKSIGSFFEAESAAALMTKPWLRLDRGMRLQKFRGYAEAYPGLSDDEKNALYQFLVKANDGKQLNTKAQITYEVGMIQSIKGLKIIRTGDPSIPAVFKIDVGRQTKKHVAPVDEI
jgi:hypothetical protein